MPSSGAQTTGPQVLAIQADGSTFCYVLFSEPVTINTGQPSQIVINGDAFIWGTQLGANDCLIDSDTSSGHSPGEPWSLAGVDIETTPNLQPPQNGLTIA